MCVCVLCGSQHALCTAAAGLHVPMLVVVETEGQFGWWDTAGGSANRMVVLLCRRLCTNRVDCTLQQELSRAFEG